MREILFRGKRVDNGGWVQGCLVKFGKESFTDEDRYGIMDKTVLVAKLHKDLNRYRTLVMGDCDYIYHNIRIAEIIPKTVGQYTGLTDKNGKKIFEGDILPIEDEIIAVVVFNDGCFRLEEYGLCGTWTESGFDECGGGWGVIDCEPIDWYTIRDMEVIGNIYDNKELVEGRRWQMKNG